MPLPPKSEISRFYPSSVVAQSGMCWTWLEIPVADFLVARLILISSPTLVKSSINPSLDDMFLHM